MYQTKKQHKKEQARIPHAKLTLKRISKPRCRALQELNKIVNAPYNSSDSDFFGHEPPRPIKKRTFCIQKRGTKTGTIISPTTASQADDELSIKHSPKDIKSSPNLLKSILRRTAHSRSATLIRTGRRQCLRSSQTANNPRPSTAQKPTETPTTPPPKPSKKNTSPKPPLETSPDTPSKPPKHPNPADQNPLTEQKKHKANPKKRRSSKASTKRLLSSSSTKQLKQWRTLAIERKKNTALLLAKVKTNEHIPFSSSMNIPVQKRPATASRPTATAGSKLKIRRLTEVERLLRDAGAFAWV
ncbi:hypothetical protein H2198_010239 [Neophaeococcomyces mojaviensis]|uniref:Uncharacterized protein n=1 Tax=Neophaeococcomyces mojaviensis TaxID=3383035 RepID=A0ACC2ZSA2_9EURO|nr:hypothetical protein H2198_010239 [Knufia sp. JES_112]